MLVAFVTERMLPVLVDSRRETHEPLGWIDLDRRAVRV